MVTVATPAVDGTSNDTGDSSTCCVVYICVLYSGTDERTLDGDTIVLDTVECKSLIHTL